MSENAHIGNFVMYVGGIVCMCNNGRQIVLKGREAVLCLLYSGGFYKNHKVGNNRFFRQLNFCNLGMSSSPHSVGLPSRSMLWTSARLVEATETHIRCWVELILRKCFRGSHGGTACWADSSVVHQLSCARQYKRYSRHDSNPPVSQAHRHSP